MSPPVPAIRQAVAHPLDLIRQQQQQLEFKPGSNFSAVEAAFRELLQDPTAQAQVPWLTPGNAASLPHNSLVRYTGMVQDQLDPEYYASSYQSPDGSQHLTDFCDEPHALASTMQPVLADRKRLFCVPVPGESAWVAEARHGTAAGTMLPGLAASAGQAATVDVLVYGSDDLKLNSVVDIIGVLSNAHLQAQDPADQLQQLNLQEQGPAGGSGLPRLHAILVRSAGDAAVLGAAVPFKDNQQLQQRCGELRQQALDLLALPLGGDRLAAEYLLLQLVSRVYVRSQEATLGVLSLSLTNCPEGSAGLGAALQAAVSMLAPRCVRLIITPEQLNTARLAPSKELETGLLTTAPLQLADGTQLLLDETQLRAGQLLEQGVANLQGLRALMERKTVAYDFGVYELPMPADVPVTMLSVGSSLLKGSVDVELPLQPVGPFASAAEVAASIAATDLAAVQAYLSKVRDMAFHLEGSMAQLLESQLVEARRQDKSLEAGTFHVWLTLSRLTALSHGEPSLSEQRWTKMRKLEHLRAERLRVAAQSRPAPARC